MSRWDLEPTSAQRWIVRHLTQVRVGAVLFLVLGLGWTFYVLVTGGPAKEAVGGSLGAISFSLLLLLNSWTVPRFVQKYDNTQHPGPNSD